MTTPTTPRQSISFPDVAIIHKGTPKQIVEKDGKTVQIQGKDLNQKFRIHFLPGTESVRAKWHAKHAQHFKQYGTKYAIPDGYEVEELRVVVPSQSVWDAWDYGNEAYSSGRRVALADDDHYISLRDPVTGEFIIHDGKPYRKFTPKDVIPYERGGKKYELIMKTHGRLRLVLEDLVTAGELVQVILKTTSFYDCQNIKKQLGGIQQIADSVNGGNAGGIPLIIYRSEQEVVWNKDDGGAARVKKWFINIKADPRWVQMAFARLGKNALTGEITPTPLLSGPVNPEAETFEDGDGDIPDIFDTTKEPPAEPAPTKEPAAPAQAKEPAAPPTPIAATQPALIEGTATDAPASLGPKYSYLGDTIVSAVSKRAGIPKNEAAVQLGAAEKAGRIQKELTLTEAEEFASHLNV